MSKPFVLVTGASAGIGLEIARCAAADGHPLVLTARRADRLQSAAADLRLRFGVEVITLPHDLGAPGGAAALVAALDARNLKPGILISNAGFGAVGPACAVPSERQTAMVQLNCTALMELTLLLAPRMRAAGGGRIMHVASTAAFQAGPGMATYYATKAFVLHWSQALAYELRGSGVVVSALCPGPTATEFAEVAEAGRTRLFKKPNIATAASVAQAGWAGLLAGRAVVVPGLGNRFLVFAIRFAPRWLVHRIVARLNAQG